MEALEEWTPHVEWAGRNDLDPATQQRCEDAIKEALGAMSRPVRGVAIVVTQYQKNPGKWTVTAERELAGQYSAAARRALRNSLPAGHEVDPAPTTVR